MRFFKKNLSEKIILLITILPALIFIVVMIALFFIPIKSSKIIIFDKNTISILSTTLSIIVSILLIVLMYIKSKKTKKLKKYNLNKYGSLLVLGISIILGVFSILNLAYFSLLSPDALNCLSYSSIFIFYISCLITLSLTLPFVSIITIFYRLFFI